MRLTKICLVASVIGVVLPAAGMERSKPPVFTISGPTLIAFFPVSPADERGETDALEDFGEYLSRMTEPLKQRGIRLEALYAKFFTVVDGSRRIVVQAHGLPGYYIVAPGRTAHIEHGVNTDDEVLKAADAYFDMIKRTH